MRVGAIEATAHGLQLLIGGHLSGADVREDRAMERVSPIAAAESESIWGATVELPKSRRLTTDLECDVCIIGGGISGFTTAYLLPKAGKRAV